MTTAPADVMKETPDMSTTECQTCTDDHSVPVKGRDLGSRNKKRYDLICPICNTAFTATRKDALSCSERCSVRLSLTGNGIRPPKPKTKVYAELRQQGASWSAIGRMCGVSRQAAQQAATGHIKRMAKNV